MRLAPPIAMCMHSFLGGFCTFLRPAMFWACTRLDSRLCNMAKINELCEVGNLALCMYLGLHGQIHSGEGRGGGGAGVWTPPPIQNCPQEVDGPFLKPPPPPPWKVNWGSGCTVHGKFPHD